MIFLVVKTNYFSTPTKIILIYNDIHGKHYYILLKLNPSISIGHSGLQFFSHVSCDWIGKIKGQIRRSRYCYLFYIKTRTMAQRGT